MYVVIDGWGSVVYVGEYCTTYPLDLVILENEKNGQYAAEASVHNKGNDACYQANQHDLSHIHIFTPQHIQTYQQ